MNLLDLILSVLIVVAAANGYRLGILARGASWIGVGIGLLLSVWTVPLALRLFDAGTAGTRLLVGGVVLILTTSVVAGIGDVVGLRLRSAVSATPLRRADRLLGGGAGALSVLVIVWLFLPAAAQVPGAIASAVRGSALVGLVRDVAPAPPDAVQALRPLIDQSRFPDVFEDLRRTPDTGPPPSQIPVPQEVVARVEAATVNVEATGCGQRFEGSGWTVQPETVVTNAHVVAGADSVRVRTPAGDIREATVVVFDDDRDLAVLQVPGLGQQPLALGAPQGDTEGAATGYPGGQNQARTVPARVTDVRTAIGRDIYGEDRTEREVVFLSANLRQGDSGGPTYDPGGTVVGTVFAVSPDRATTAFALAPSEIQAAVAAPRVPGETGRCVS